MKFRALAVIVLAAGAFVAGCSGAGTPADGTSESASANGSDGVALKTTSSASPEAGTESLPTEPTPSPTTTSFRDVVMDGKVSSAEVCKTLETPLVKFQKEAARRIGTAQGKVKDPYAAASFRKNYPWVKDPLGSKFDAAMDAASTKALNSLSDGQAGLVDDFDAYLPAAIEACGLEEKYSAAGAKVNESESLAQSIRTKANSKPWYPKGFDEYGFDSDLAVRWIAGADADCFSRCWYWTMEVISQSGCPSGVYGELSIEKNGTAVSWTNDSLSYLRPNQRGRMQFITYDDRAYGGSGTLAELSCY